MLKEETYLAEFDKIVSQFNVESKPSRSKSVLLQVLAICGSMYLSNVAAVYIWRLLTCC